MDFFADQVRARRKTGLLVLMFLVAVAGTVLSIDIVVGYVYLLAYERPIAGTLSAVPSSVYAVTTLLALLVIVSGSWTRMHALSEGGAAVAAMVGARRLKENSKELQERRLLNVIEEMSLAAGISLPRVYVMDNEAAINAFAAGYSPNQATVVVTRGALERLNRDQLQGVVAHEFSHILNGDMRLNIRLLGVIAGLVMVASIGDSLNRDLHWDNLLDRKSTATPPTALWSIIGLVLWTIGSIGLLFGRLIRAVISREREFLADASAVQFTRNPEGLAAALLKIGEGGSGIYDSHAEELSHMCIGAPAGDSLEFAWFRTHPPLDERIERLLGPGAKRLLSERIARSEAAMPADWESPVVPELASPLLGRQAAAPLAGAAGTAHAIAASIGNPSDAHVDYARRVLGTIPADLRAAVRTAAGAKAAVLSLLLGEGEMRQRQVSLIDSGSTAGTGAQSASFADALKPLGARVRLPLFDLAIPALKDLPYAEREEFLGTIQAVVETDGKVTLGEYILLILCRSHLRMEKGGQPVRHRGIASVADETEILLSLIAHAGGGGPAAFESGMAALGLAGGALRSPEELKIPVIEGALGELTSLAPLKKPLVVKACVAAAMSDDKLAVVEGELLRAICATLDTPLPPILETAEAVA